MYVGVNVGGCDHVCGDLMDLLIIQMDTCSATISQKASKVEENRTAETQAKVRVQREERYLMTQLLYHCLTSVQHIHVYTCTVHKES